jgi:enamine deaminase RidA (YjgF/YER057c/UK114 family)
MGPIDPVTEKIIEGDITVQTRQVFKNLQAILAEKNADFSQVIKVTTHLQDVHKDFAAYDAVCREFLTEPFPVRTTVGSELMNILVEIDLVVAL